MNINCEFIASARPIDKATAAEELASSSHRVMKCEKCNKFHVWVEVSRLEWSGSASARHRITEDLYTKVGPRSYLHKGYQRTKKKVRDENNDED